MNIDPSCVLDGYHRCEVCGSKTRIGFTRIMFMNFPMKCLTTHIHSWVFCVSNNMLRIAVDILMEIYCDDSRRIASLQINIWLKLNLKEFRQLNKSFNFFIVVSSEFLIFVTCCLTCWLGLPMKRWPEQVSYPKHINCC